MFSVHCEDCGTTHLYGPRRIVGMTNTDAGIIVSFRCFCGGTASILTGRATTEASATAPVEQPAAAPAAGHPADERELVGCGSVSVA